MTGPRADRIVVDTRVQGGDDARSPANSHVLQRAASRAPRELLYQPAAVRERKDVNETTFARFITRETLTKESRYAAELRVISGIVTRVPLQSRYGTRFKRAKTKRRGIDTRADFA